MGSGPGQDQEFPCRSRRRRRVDGTLSKMEIGNESYLEEILGNNSDGKLHGLLLRIFFNKTHQNICIF